MTTSSLIKFLNQVRIFNRHNPQKEAVTSDFQNCWVLPGTTQSKYPLNFQTLCSQWSCHLHVFLGYPKKHHKLSRVWANFYSCLYIKSHTASNKTQSFVIMHIQSKPEVSSNPSSHLPSLYCSQEMLTSHMDKERALALHFGAHQSFYTSYEMIHY